VGVMRGLPGNPLIVFLPIIDNIPAYGILDKIQNEGNEVFLHLIIARRLFPFIGIMLS